MKIEWFSRSKKTKNSAFQDIIQEFIDEYQYYIDDIPIHPNRYREGSLEKYQAKIIELKRKACLV